MRRNMCREPAAVVIFTVSLGLASVSQAIAQNNVSFARQVKPIFDTKCVSCHACYDAPGQLDLTSAIGVQRGAMKIEPYAPHFTPAVPTILWNSPNSIEDWRKIGFFSVIEGGENSIMAKMLALGRSNPAQSNARYSDSVELDALKRKNFLPNAQEIDGYAAAHPTEGMPLAVAGLTAGEYTTIINWLKEGAPFDTEVSNPTAVEQAKIEEWERYRTGATIDRG